MSAKHDYEVKLSTPSVRSDIATYVVKNATSVDLAIAEASALYQWDHGLWPEAITTEQLDA